MNMTNADFKAIEKALRLLPQGAAFDALSKEDQDTIIKADVVMVNLLRKKKKDVARQVAYINNKRKENPNYGRGKSIYIKKGDR